MNNMNIYTTEEIEKINKVKEANDRMEEFFNEKKNEWNNAVEPLFKVLSININDSTFHNSIIESQALALSYKQMLNDQISYFLNKRSKEMTKIKRLKQDKFMFYATGFGLKTNLSEKTIMIEAHLSEYERTIEIIDIHIDFLRETSKNIESFLYSIKNMIELLNYIGK